MKGPLDLGLFTFKKSTVRFHVYTHIQLGYDVYVPKSQLSCGSHPTWCGSPWSHRMSDWTHPICEVCWQTQNPDRWPTRVIANDEAHICCWCLATTWCGIYVRANPESLNASTTPCSPASHKISEVWLRKARRTQRANHFMRWFYLTNITLNVVLSYVGESPWVSGSLPSCYSLRSLPTRP